MNERRIQNLGTTRGFCDLRQAIEEEPELRLWKLPAVWSRRIVEPGAGDGKTPLVRYLAEIGVGREMTIVAIGSWPPEEHAADRITAGGKRHAECRVIDVIIDVEDG